MFGFNYWGMHPVASVSIKYQNTSVRNKSYCVIYCALSRLHVYMCTTYKYILYYKLPEDGH
jgi:hypothetical protein